MPAVTYHAPAYMSGYTLRLDVLSLAGEALESIALTADGLLYSGTASTASGTQVFARLEREVSEDNWSEVGAGFETIGNPWLIGAVLLPTNFAALDITSEGVVSANAVVGGLTAQQVRDSMKLAPTAGDPADGSIDAVLEEIAGADNSNIGPGSYSKTIRIYSINAQPLSGAEVWISTDSQGLNVVAGTLVTNDAGDVTFMLDLNVLYYIWCDHPDANFTNPTPKTFT